MLIIRWVMCSYAKSGDMKRNIFTFIKIYMESRARSEVHKDLLRVAILDRGVKENITIKCGLESMFADRDATLSCSSV